MNTEEKFPIIDTMVVRGKEYVLIDCDVFVNMFKTLMAVHGQEQEMVQYLLKEYEKAKRHKKRRIRLKKQKQVLIVMYHIMMPLFSD